MQYMVIWSDGNKYGPADLTLLNQWASEGRITPDTQLEPVAGGPTIRAGELAGLVIPGATPVTADSVATSMPITVPMAVESSSAPHEATINPTADPSSSLTPAGTASNVTGSGQFYVIGPGGAKYGPADVPTLAKWKTENRVNDATELEDAASGRRVSAAELLSGATMQSAPSSPQPGMPSTGYQQPGGFQPGGFAQPQQPINPYAQAPQAYADPEAGKKEFNSSIIAAVLGLFCCGIIAPAVGIYYGIQAKNLGHKNGQVAIIINVVVLVIDAIGLLVAFAARR